MIKILKDVALVVFLFIAMANFGKANEDGGVRLENGCYTLHVIVEGDHGKKIILVQDCRGGRKIWKELV